jgi:hypothetical protein
MQDIHKIMLASVAITLLGLINVFDGFVTGYRTLTWEKTQGTVMLADTEHCSRGKAGSGLKVRISYAYRVNQKAYSASRIAPAEYETCLSDREAWAVLSRNRQDAKVPVYFDEKKPEKAFVLGGKIGRWYNLLIVLIGIAFLLLARYSPSSLSWMFKKKQQRRY